MPGSFNLDDYEPVEDRLRAFWTDHPHGRVATELVRDGDPDFIVKASVYREQFIASDGLHLNEHPAATGYAQEVVTERGVNATSALENCETSAIGRALANLGYAAKGKRPSREEMSKAVPSDKGKVGGGRPAQEAGAGGASAGVATAAPALLPVHVEAIEDLATLWEEATKAGLTERKASALATQRGIGKKAADLTVPQMREVLTHWLTMKAKSA